MQVTTELLDNEIKTMEVRLKQATASANEIAGALVVLRDLRAYLDKEEEKPNPKADISPENAEIQLREAQAQEVRRRLVEEAEVELLDYDAVEDCS